jgi:hypothetical protein
LGVSTFFLSFAIFIHELTGFPCSVLNRLLIIFQVVILLLSELSWAGMCRFFDAYFPVLGPSFGLGALGLFECLLGATILSHHVDDFTLVSAFFLFSVGCLNALLGLVFRERAKGYRSIPAFRAAARPVLPTHVDAAPQPPATASSFGFGPGTDEKRVPDWDASETYARGSAAGAPPPRSEWAGYGFGRQGEKAAGLRGFLISKPAEAAPPYGGRPVSVASSGSSRGRSPARSERTAASREHSAERPVPTFHSSPTAL